MKKRKKNRMKLLEENKSRIKITTDMWTANNQKRGYMTVTAHFIDDSWILQSQIVRYVMLFSCFNVIFF